MHKYNYKKGLPAIFACYLLWGFQSLYWNLCSGINTFFMLVSRIIWASVFCIVVLKIQGKFEQYISIFKNKKILLREACATVFLFLDWGIYLWAVQNGKVLDCALGYYIQPVVVFIFGAILFGEKVSWKHIIILIFIMIGIIWSAKGFNGIPWITVTLALLFSIYAAIKKGLGLDSIVSTSCEITLMVPIAVLMILLFFTGENGLSGLNFQKFMLLAGSGAITAAPMLLFSIALSNLSMQTNAICQYLSPTISIFCGKILGESLTHDKLMSFVFVWIAVVLYTADTIYKSHKSHNL